jgi:RNA polymerase sigma-70 factor, ECF subfamily
MQDADDLHAEDDDQFIRCFTSSQRPLYAFIVGMTPSRTDADDILQEVNLALWRKRHLYDRTQDFLRWAFGYAVVEIRGFRSRSAKGRLCYSDKLLDAFVAEWPTDLDAEQQRRDALAACLEKLGPNERQLVAAFYCGDVTAQELAEAAGKPLRTVYNMLERARECLRKCVQNTLAQAQHPRSSS